MHQLEDKINVLGGKEEGGSTAKSVNTMQKIIIILHDRSLQNNEGQRQTVGGNGDGDGDDGVNHRLAKQQPLDERAIGYV